MLFLPLPFVITILLLVLFAVIARSDDETPANLPFLALILVCAFQTLLVGLRWGYEVTGVSYIAPLSAALIPPLTFSGISRLVRASHQPLSRSIAFHALPCLVIAVLMLTWQIAIDMALVLIYVGYAVAILVILRPGEDSLGLASFEGVARAWRAVIFAAMALILSAVVDLFVFLDLAWNQGELSLMAITAGNLAALIILAIAAAFASRSRTPADTIEAGKTASDMIEDPSPGNIQETGSDDSDSQFREDRVQTVNGAHAPAEKDTSLAGDVDDPTAMAVIQALMETQKLYRNVDLNLNRLARKAGIPSRQISGAINRRTGKNVSQYVNEYRIAEACHLLTGTEKPVTEIMLEVGFLTKSNFNREFRQVTDMSPVEWREKKSVDRY